MFGRTFLSLAAAVAFAAVLVNRPTNSASRSNSSAQPATESDFETLKKHVMAREREELDALKTGDLQRFAALIADDAVFVDDHGPATKAEIVSHTAEFRLTEYAMDDVRFVPVSRDSGLISYKIAEKGTSHGRDFAATVYVSALWVHRGDKWLCVFSQETAARPPRP
jgi:ketosteroid isomerase-like protein